MAGCASSQPKPMALWKNVPGMKGKPTKLYAYPAPKENNHGYVVIVCPGGSYAHTMGIATEGFAVAEWLNSQGISAFVLKYRTGSQGYHHPAMLEDVQMAIHYVRQHAKEYGYDPHKLGVMGFSAGGHLALMSGSLAKENHISKYGFKDNISLRPDFVVPIYPVVTMKGDIVHQRSRKNLLSRKRTPELETKFSMELNIPRDMPPTFVATAKDDPVVDYRNSVQLDHSLSKAQIPHQFMLFETGGHGYGMSEKLAPEAGKWKNTFLKWLGSLKL